MRPSIAALAPALMAASAAAAIALAPAQWTAPPAQPVSLTIQQRTGDGDQPIPWPADDIDWMFVRAGPRQWNLHQPPPTNGQQRTIQTASAGATMIGLELAPRIERIDPPALPDLLAREGASTSADARQAAGALLAPAAAQQPLRIRITQCAQAIIRAADDMTDVPAPVALAKAGLPAEIRLLMDPTALVAPTDIMVRIYAGSASRQGALVRAHNLTTGARTETTSAEHGIATLTLPERGVWRLEFAWAERLEDDPEADIAIWTCSLGFEMTREN
ncbi:MAG: hypothetical protein ACF8R7_03215 [Phycisphaerales bacterium JB039]